MTRQTEPTGQAARHDDPLMLFSSDSHVGPRLVEDLREYCPQKYRHQYDEFVASEYANPDVGLEVFLETFSDEYRHGCRRNLRTAGHHDALARLRDMDRDGVAGSVIFHNSLNGQPFPFDLVNAFGNAAPTSAERELFGVGRSMYNRWLSDFCSVAPERTAGLAQLPFWDIEAATAELEWAAEHGLSGVNFPAPGVFGNVQPDDPSFDRFFAAAAALDMTLATHIGSTVPTEHGNLGMPTLAHRMFLQMDSTEWGIRVVYALVFFGAFERVACRKGPEDRGRKRPRRLPPSQRRRLVQGRGRHRPFGPGTAGSPQPEHLPLRNRNRHLRLPHARPLGLSHGLRLRAVRSVGVGF
jgi:hypothetical protein